MATILLSIKPEFIIKIITGTKEFEYRTKIPKEPVNKILFYATYPIQSVIGQADVSETLKIDPKILWDETKVFSGISKDYFDKYFKNRSVGYAYKLENVRVFDKPKKLSDFKIKSAPQSFIYLKSE